jgi:hypothetical protein
MLANSVAVAVADADTPCYCSYQGNVGFLLHPLSSRSVSFSSLKKCCLRMVTVKERKLESQMKMLFITFVYIFHYVKCLNFNVVTCVSKTALVGSYNIISLH